MGILNLFINIATFLVSCIAIIVTCESKLANRHRDRSRREGLRIGLAIGP